MPTDSYKAIDSGGVERDDALAQGVEESGHGGLRVVLLGEGLV